MPKLHHALFTLALAGIASMLATPAHGAAGAAAGPMRHLCGSGNALRHRTLDGAIVVVAL